MMENPSRRALMCAGLAVALLPACREASKAAEPREFTQSTTCALDGMVLADYPGPKGQIQYDAGPPDFYCDTVELLATFLRPEQQKHITAVHTQDMGKADWNEPRGHWIDARTAFYVRGSKLRGSMGPTLASFGVPLTSKISCAVRSSCSRPKATTFRPSAVKVRLRPCRT